jgi:hypothetical protein
MGKHRIGLLFAVVLILWPLVPALAQSTARWEGIVTRSNKQKSTFTVRARGSTSFDEKVIHYDSSTQFSYQGHGDKTPKDIDPSQIKDGDRVICVGFYNDKHEFQAALISKRISD